MAAMLTAGCTTTKKASNQNLSFLYRRDASIIHPKFFVYHTSDSSSQLYFEINSAELLYAKQKFDATDFSASITINYRLTSSFESGEIIDSATITIYDKKITDGNRSIIGSMAIKAKTPNTYLLQVNITDVNRDQTARSYINIDKNNTHSAQNFIVRTTVTQEPVFKNYFDANEEVLISTRNKDLRKLYIRFYKRNFPVAAPPFSVTVSKTFEYKADSSFTIAMNDTGTALFKIFKNGFYHIQTDTATNEGITLFSHYKNFPEITNVDMLVEPLCYITTREEFDEMLIAKNKKQAMDNFWSKTAGSQERAKELIRKFYNRIKDANLYFTSYLEGWKTDRGMIYLIYGPPNVIYKSTTSESWVYGEENNFMSLTYTFFKVKNPFTNNDYALDRSTVYKNTWYKAVDIWRQGRVYLDN